MKSINPATGELVAAYTPHTPEELDGIVESAHEAWRGWAETDLKRRRGLLHALADLLEAEAGEHACRITTEMGKTVREAGAEIAKCATACRWFADGAEDVLASEPVATAADRSYVAYEPLGVILAVMPWNFPYWQVLRFAAPAIMAGNAVVLKHASNVSGCALALEELFARAGYPENLFRTVLAPGAAAERVVAHPLVRGVTLTGSGPAGARVAELAGRHLKKCVLELGGSDPFVVFADADVEQAARVAAIARARVCGQVCIAAKRMIVVDSVADGFVDSHRRHLEALVVGDPMDPATDMGPLARHDLVDSVHEQVSTSVSMGAKLVTGGYRLDRPGNFYAPTLLTGVARGMPAHDEETFGPVSCVIRVKDEAEALRVANDTPFGLGGSVWTAEDERGEAFARRMQAGAVFVNGQVKSDCRLPFGGIKGSGFGREMGTHGFRTFTNVKSVWVRQGR